MLTMMPLIKPKLKNKQLILSDVPDDMLSKIVSSFKRDGADKVEVDVQPNGKYQVLAHFIHSNW